ncbi:MAG: hypothetical protein V4563_17740 [Pseudomonadota bacterium]
MNLHSRISRWVAVRICETLYALKLTDELSPKCWRSSDRLWLDGGKAWQVPIASLFGWVETRTATPFFGSPIEMVRLTDEGKYMISMLAAATTERAEHE